MAGACTFLLKKFLLFTLTTPAIILPIPGKKQFNSRHKIPAADVLEVVGQGMCVFGHCSYLQNVIAHRAQEGGVVQNASHQLRNPLFSDVGFHIIPQTHLATVPSGDDRHNTVPLNLNMNK